MRSELGPCQRSLFTQDSSKSASERAHCAGEGKCKYQPGVDTTHACSIHQLHMGCIKSYKYTYIYIYLNIQKKNRKTSGVRRAKLSRTYIQFLSQKARREAQIPRNPECSAVDVMLFDLLLWLDTVSQIRLSLLFLPTDHGLTGKACQFSLCICMFSYLPLSACWFKCEHA